MSMRLKGDTGEVRLDLASWYFTLELGRQYGWEPLGTLLRASQAAAVQDGSGKRRQPRGPHRGEFSWYNSYILGRGRRVSTEDARHLADALARALDDVPDHDATSHKPRAYPMPRAMARMLHDLPDEGMPDPSQYVNALEWFSGPRKQLLRDLIAFCKTAGFAVR